MSVEDPVSTIRDKQQKYQASSDPDPQRDLDKNVDLATILIPGEYPVWSPIDAHEASEVLTQFFKEYGLDCKCNS